MVVKTVLKKLNFNPKSRSLECIIRRIFGDKTSKILGGLRENTIKGCFTIF
ncbi:hypothetical protein NPIRD3C_0037 [Nitrosopumilus piranensis]|uniref:Uncharacterized protein n=1 Tax=Nitrosopumilus piranensis TaxID=1582439 RepID=A0A0C5BSH5_9ARCH|nr:hypothetical protein NPIRD3C_0037 [Nitrosopumilus piranensis]